MIVPPAPSEISASSSATPALPDSPEQISAILSASVAGLRIRCNRNRQTLVSLRSARDGHLVLSIRPELLIAELLPELTRFIHRRGHGRYPLLRQHMHRLFETLSSATPKSVPLLDPQLAALPTLGPGPVNLYAIAEAVYQRYHHDVPPVPVSWSRAAAAGRRLRSIRFGTYRPGPPPRITIHPRLGQPWIAQCFLELVIHHEYCHHRQQCRPGLGRRMRHGPRFRSLEHRFAAVAQAQAWERAFLPCLLDPQHPKPEPSCQAS